MEKFTENSLKERDAIKKSNILNIFKESMAKKNYDFSYEYVTAYDGFDHYDAAQCFVKYENGKNEYIRFLIEVKVRSEVYDEMFLELDKWKELNKIREEISGQFKLLYINYTPKGTYIFDITKMDDFILTKREMKQYSSKESKRINKKVYLLPLNKAKYLPFIYNHNDFKPNYNEELNKSIEIKKLYDIFGQQIEIDKATNKYESKSKNIAKIHIKSDKSYFEFNKEQEINFKEIEDFMEKKKL
jgi:hypothetical protein